MPDCRTKFHGLISFEPEQVLRVPQGLFGFPDEQEFLLLELPSSRPVVFLQSIKSENLCFITLPVQMVQPDYHLLRRHDGGRPATDGQVPQMGKDLLCLALLTMRENQITTANLKAPLVIDIACHTGIQVIVEQDYSHYHPLPGTQRSHSHAY
jgi:flagellar assembly factor FliW